MHELVYDDREVEVVITKHYNNAIITDARDEIHHERFEVDIPNITQEVFFKFALRNGFLLSCFTFNLILHGGSVDPQGRNKAQAIVWETMYEDGKLDEEYIHVVEH